MENKIAPYGQLSIFLNPSQLKKLDDIKETRENEIFQTLVNQSLVPYKVEINPLGHVFLDTEVDHGLDALVAFSSHALSDTLL